MLRKKLHFLCILLACLLSILPNLGLASEADKLVLTEFEEKYYVNQDDALNAYEKLQEYFGYPDVCDPKSIWPENYGGCYINNDAQLVICFTDLNDAIIKKYIDICGDSIIFEKVAFSYNALIHIQNSIIEYANKVKDDNIAFIGVTSKNNIVDLKLYDQAKSNDFYDLIIDNPYYSEGILSITERTAPGPVDEEAYNAHVAETLINETSISSRSYSISPGSKINNNESGAWTATIWATRYDGQLGIITCGHPFYYYAIDNDFHFDEFNTAKSVVYVGTTTSLTLGQTSSSYTDVDTYTDYSFISANPSYVGTTMLVNGVTITSALSGTAPTGTVLYGYGSTSGLFTGPSLYDSGFFGHDGILQWAYTMDLSDYQYGSGWVDSGDSGAPIYGIVNGSRKLVSIQSSACWPLPSKVGYSVRIDYAFGHTMTTLFTG